MSNVDAPDVSSGETNNPDLLSEQSGMSNMSSKKTFTVDTDMQVNGDLGVTGTVTATSFIGDGSQLTGISGGGPQSEIINGNAFVRIEDGDPDGDSDAPVNLKMVSVGGTDLWDVDVLTINDVSITTGDDVNISAADNVIITSVDYMDLISEDNIYLTAGGKIDLESSDYIELNADVYVRDHPLRLQDDFAGVNPGMESFVQDLDLATSTEVPSAIAVKSVTDDLQSQIDNFSGGGGLDSAGVQGIVDDNITGGILSVQIGPSTSVADALQQTVIGPSASSNGQYNVVIGRNAKVQSSRTAGTAIGNDARVGSSQGGNNGVAVGTNAVVEKNAGTAIGPNAYVKNGDNATAVGMQANAWGTSALALGHGASATSSNTIAIGTNTSASTQYEIDIRTSAAGSLTYDTTNDWTFGATVNAPAFVGDGSGLTGLPSGGGLDSAATIALIGMQNKSAGDNAIQITPDTSTLNGDNNNIIIGTQISDMAGIGPQSIAMGYDIGAQANGVSIGYQAGAGSQSTNTGGVFIGWHTNYFGNSNPADYAIAIGHEAGAVYPGVGSVALGKSAGAGSSGDYTVAIGYKANDTSNFNNTIMIKADGSSAYNSTAQYDIDIRTSAAGSLTYDTTNDWTFGAGVTMTDLVASGATVVFNNLPTVDPVNAGQLWNDAGTMKISAGI